MTEVVHITLTFSWFGAVVYSGFGHINKVKLRQAPKPAFSRQIPGIHPKARRPTQPGQPYVNRYNEV